MIEENNLIYEEYLEMINSVDWKCPSKRLLEKSLKNSMTVKYIQNGNIVGMARLVTDNGYMALVSDVIVKPEYQGKHIGKKMINSLLNRVKDTLEDGKEMMIQLLAANGKVEFYEKFGFKVKKEVAEEGMYMWFKK